MPLIALPAPCWTYTCRNDRHHPLQLPHAVHRDDLAARPGCDRPYQLDHRCIRALCGGCYLPFRHATDAEPRANHFPTRQTATAALTAAGWVTDTARRWLCPDCARPVPYALTPAAHTALAAA